MDINERITRYIRDDPHITELKFTGYHFDTLPNTLPDSIGNLTNLIKLNLYDNRLTTLPDTIGNLTNLTALDLDYNQLTALPDTIGNLTNLTTLDLDYNYFTEFPSQIGKLTNLVELNINNNDIVKSLDFRTVLRLEYLTERQLIAEWIKYHCN